MSKAVKKRTVMAHAKASAAKAFASAKERGYFVASDFTKSIQKYAGQNPASANPQMRHCYDKELMAITVRHD
jgi:hypothetical protein